MDGELLFTRSASQYSTILTRMVGATIFLNFSNYSDCPCFALNQGGRAQFTWVNEHFQSYRVLLSPLTYIPVGDAELAQTRG